MVSTVCPSHALPTFLALITTFLACTSAVTQISYHDKLKIEADIEFISGTDWEEELTKLLEDVRNDRPGARDSKAVSNQAYERVRFRRSLFLCDFLLALIHRFQLRCLYPLYTDNDFRNLTAEKIFENPANEGASNCHYTPPSAG